MYKYKYQIDKLVMNNQHQYSKMLFCKEIESYVHQVRVKRLLHRLEFLSELPERLEKCVCLNHNDYYIIMLRIS